MTPAEENNLAFVLDWWRKVIEARHTELAANYAAEDFIQHNPNIPTGRAALVTFFKSLGPAIEPIPDRIANPPVVAGAKGDFVWLVFEHKFQNPKDTSQSVYEYSFDLFAEEFGLYISSGLATLDRQTVTGFWSLARTARAQVMQAFDPVALRARAAAMASVVAAKPSPQIVYEKVWRSGSYNAVLTNLGRFPDMPKLKRFRVTAVYPILSPELEPVVAVATSDQRAYITISSPPSIAHVSTSFLERLRRQTH